MTIIVPPISGQYAFFSGVEGGDRSKVVSSGTADIELALTGSEATTWDTKPGYMTFDGSSNYFSALLNDLSASSESLLTLGSDIILTSFILDAAKGATRMPIRVGANTGGMDGYELRFTGTGMSQGRVRYSTGFETISGSTAYEDNSDELICMVLDNQQANPLIGQSYFFNNMRNSQGNANFRDAGPISFDKTTSGNASYMSIGAGMWNNNPELHFAGSIKNLLIRRFPSPMPQGITKYIQQLYIDGGIPAEEQ